MIDAARGTDFHHFVKERLIQVKDDLIIYCELGGRDPGLDITAVADAWIVQQSAGYIVVFFVLFVEHTSRYVWDVEASIAFTLFNVIRYQLRFLDR